MTIRHPRLRVAPALLIVLLTTPSSGEGAAQYISTCQAVGCHGGKPGCYWYMPNGLDGGVVYCYGSRP
jgi:hypothetical protein